MTGSQCALKAGQAKDLAGFVVKIKRVQGAQQAQQVDYYYYYGVLCEVDQTRSMAMDGWLVVNRLQTLTVKKVPMVVPFKTR